MGNNLVDDETNYMFQCEPFTPIYFLPKIFGEKTEKSPKPSFYSSKDKNKTLNFDSQIILEKKNLENEETKETKENQSEQILKKYIKKLYNDESNDNDIEHCYTKFFNGFNKCINNYNNLFIFDWDNTLLPTYFLSQENIIDEEYLPSEYLEIFSLLDISVYKLLKKSLEKGFVNIISNSSYGWVEHSANKYFPSLKKIFKYINVISAKNDYQNAYPDDTKMWKNKACLSLKTKIDPSLTTNIICIGDLNNDLDAGKNLAHEVGNCFIKTIKFKERPEPDDIIKQINLILTKFNYIFSNPKNVSMILDYS